VDLNDPEIRRLAASIKKHGIKEPLVITADRYILSGHRRYAAAMLVGQVTVPCRVMRFKRAGMDKSKYIEQLREHNRQRDKNLTEKLREELVSIDPNEAYQSLIAHRYDASFFPAETVQIEGSKSRSRITDVKGDMLRAVKKIIFVDRKNFWPMTVRAIHYALLYFMVLRNTGDPGSTYINDRILGGRPRGAIGNRTKPHFSDNCLSLRISPMVSGRSSLQAKRYSHANS
jgi:hypothetical protein